MEWYFFWLRLGFQLNLIATVETRFENQFIDIYTNIYPHSSSVCFDVIKKVYKLYIEYYMCTHTHTNTHRKLIIVVIQKCISPKYDTASKNEKQEQQKKRCVNKKYIYLYANEQVEVFK